MIAVWNTVMADFNRTIDFQVADKITEIQFFMNQYYGGLLAILRPAYCEVNGASIDFLFWVKNFYSHGY